MAEARILAGASVIGTALEYRVLNKLVSDLDPLAGHIGSLKMTGSGAGRLVQDWLV